MNYDCPHCHQALGGNIALRNTRSDVVCTKCHGNIIANRHPILTYLEPALWLALCATLYVFFAGYGLWLAGTLCLTLFALLAIYTFVTKHYLRDWSVFVAR